MSWTDAIPFLSTYPVWARIVVLAGIVIVLGVLVLVPRQPSKESATPQHGISARDQSAAIINNVIQATPPSRPVLSPSQERLLILRADYQRQYAASKLVVSRKDGRLHFDGDLEKGKDVSLIRDLFGSVDSSKQTEFVGLMESIPPEYLRSFPEMRWGSPFVVGITDSGSRYMRERQ
jgi:hypothetical protein